MSEQNISKAPEQKQAFDDQVCNNWNTLSDEGALKFMCGGNKLSRELDLKGNLEDFVRLSFSPNHPMRFTCVRDKRIHNVAILEINITICGKIGTLLCDRNATRKKALISVSLESVNFDIVKNPNQFSVSEVDKPFYQAEILVKNHIPVDFITFPPTKANLSFEEFVRIQSFQIDPDVNPLVEENHSFDNPVPSPDVFQTSIQRPTRCYLFSLSHGTSKKELLPVLRPKSFATSNYYRGSRSFK